MTSDLINSVGLSLVGLSFAILIFMMAEPAVSLGAGNSLVVYLNVGTEISFATSASNITLAPSINASTGGTADGGTQVVVKTNDLLGYSMTLAASSSVGMIGVASSTNSIPAYVPAVAGVPDFSFTVPVNRAYFGYTVEASTTADLTSSFKDLAGACGAVLGSDTADKCWINASTSDFPVVNRNSATPASGATTTLKFRVVINANPVPLIPNDTYVATTTLTATAN